MDVGCSFLIPILRSGSPRPSHRRLGSPPSETRAESEDESKAEDGNIWFVGASAMKYSCRSFRSFGTDIFKDAGAFECTDQVPRLILLTASSRSARMQERCRSMSVSARSQVRAVLARRASIQAHRSMRRHSRSLCRLCFICSEADAQTQHRAPTNWEELLDPRSAHVGVRAIAGQRNCARWYAH